MDDGDLNIDLLLFCFSLLGQKKKKTFGKSRRSFPFSARFENLITLLKFSRQIFESSTFERFTIERKSPFSARFLLKVILTISQSTKKGREISLEIAFYFKILI